MNHTRWCKKIQKLFFCGLLCCMGCHPNANKQEITDPTETYSIIKADSNSGITIVSETENNPMKVRGFIDNYTIPETNYYEKRSKFYNLLDNLKLLSTKQEEMPYNEVDSLNYMAIHYLKDLLKDKQSLQSPIRHNLLKTSISPDKKLKVYSWNENIGFETNSYINVYQYHWKDGDTKAFFNKDINSDNELNISSGQIEKMYLLTSANETPALYLHIISGIQGSNYYKGVTMIKVTEDTMYFDQPLLKEETNNFNSIVLHYQKQNPLQISYDKSSKKLTVQKHITIEDKDSLQISKYLFDGTCFEKIEE